MSSLETTVPIVKPKKEQEAEGEKSYIRQVAEKTGEKILTGYENLTSTITHTSHYLTEKIGIP
jgi:hypothetical protein